MASLGNKSFSDILYNVTTIYLETPCSNFTTLSRLNFETKTLLEVLYYFWPVHEWFVRQNYVPHSFDKRSLSILDQIFCKVPCKEQADISAAILLSGISDHLPCVVNFKILKKPPEPPKYIYKRTVTESSLEQYRTDMRSLNIHTYLKADLMVCPDGSCQTFENLIQKSYQRHLLQKRVIKQVSTELKVSMLRL